MFSLSGCTASSKSGSEMKNAEGNAGEQTSSSQWGLPACNNNEYPVKVRGASIVDSQRDPRGGYRTELKIVVEVLGAENQALWVENADIFGEKGDKVGSISNSAGGKSWELQPAATKVFDFTTSTSNRAVRVDNIVIPSMSPRQWRAASLVDLQDKKNRACQ